MQYRKIKNNDNMLTSININELLLTIIGPVVQWIEQKFPKL